MIEYADTPPLLLITDSVTCLFVDDAAATC